MIQTQAAQQRIAKENSALTCASSALFVLLVVGYVYEVQLRIGEAVERKTENIVSHCGTMVCYTDVPVQNHSHDQDTLLLARSNEKTQQ